MKKLVSSSLAGLMLVSLAACSGNTTTPSTTAATGTDTPSTEGTTALGSGGTAATYTIATSVADYTGPTEMTYYYTTDVATMDYVTSALAEDHCQNVNFVDGLVENDAAGNIVPSLAESWDHNEDATVWTFHIRPDVYWVTNTGEVYEQVTAQDWVTGMQHAADFNSGTGWLLEGVIKNYKEYTDGLVGFEEVGVKAIDDLTLEYTLESSTPYFETMANYTILYPVNKTFLESRGTGCALGNPVIEECTFGAAGQPDSILYNGAYILQSYDFKSSIVMTKNPSYWDADHVYLETITQIFDDGSDPYSKINAFEAGTYPAAYLETSWADYQSYADKYAGFIVASEPNASVFGIQLNFNRLSYEYSAHTTDEDKANTQAAIRNENFRKALRAAFDKTSYLAVSAPLDVAEETLRNINNYPEVVHTGDGKSYGTLVEEAYAEMTGDTRSLADGQDAFFSAEEAMSYIEAAEADGVVFPVTLDMPTLESNQRLVNQANSLKQSVEANTEGNILINVVMLNEDEINATCYNQAGPEASDYDINTFAGWSPDYADPKSFVDIVSPTTGYLMNSFGFVPADQDEDPDAAVKEELGFYEYEELYRTADAITDDMDARYEAFAQADAYLVAHALYIPSYQQTRTQWVRRFIPFTKQDGQTGIGEYKWKGLQLVSDGIITAADYEARRAEVKGE